MLNFLSTQPTQQQQHDSVPHSAHLSRKEDELLEELLNYSTISDENYSSATTLSLTSI